MASRVKKQTNKQKLIPIINSVKCVGQTTPKRETKTKV